MGASVTSKKKFIPTSRDEHRKCTQSCLTEKRRERSCVRQESVFIAPGFLEGKQISL